ncbi:hypothetical protein HOD08_03945 [bacterium]|mgnify:CR=1 FL=1|nr:hypothetical protein [bacterium]
MLNFFGRAVLACGVVCAAAGSCHGSGDEANEIVTDVCCYHLGCSSEGVQFGDLSSKIVDQVGAILKNPEKDCCEEEFEDEDGDGIVGAQKLLCLLDGFYRNAAENGDPAGLIDALEKDLDETISESSLRIALANSFVELASQLHGVSPLSVGCSVRHSLKDSYVFRDLGMTYEQVERAKCLHDFWLASTMVSTAKYDYFVQSDFFQGLSGDVQMCLVQAIHGVNGSSDFLSKNHFTKLCGFVSNISMIVDMIGYDRTVEIIGCFLSFKTPSEAELEYSWCDSRDEFEESVKNREKFCREQAKNIVDLCDGKVIPKAAYEKLKNRSVFDVHRNALSHKNILGYSLVLIISEFPALERDLG